MTIKKRPRRIRNNPFSRNLARENRLMIEDLIYPIFIIEGQNIKQPILSMPGVFRLSIDNLIQEAKECYELGIQAIALFPVIDKELKSEDASEAFNDNGLIPRLLRN